MIIGNNINNTSFGRIFAVSANKAQFQELHSIVKDSKGQYGLYGIDRRKLRMDGPDNFIKKAKANNQDVYILIAGKKDLKNVILGKKGWNSISGLCGKISQYITLDNVKADVKPILNAIKEEN